MDMNCIYELQRDVEAKTMAANKRQEEAKRKFELITAGIYISVALTNYHIVSLLAGVDHAH